MMGGIPWDRRTAHFKCVIAIATPEGKLRLCQGKRHGIIAFEAKGENGFGYDPIFYLPELAKTMAELPLELKNQLSHRGQVSPGSGRYWEQLWNAQRDCLCLEEWYTSYWIEYLVTIAEW